MADAIGQRISVRSYSGQPLEEEVREKLAEICRGPHCAPFSSPVRFRLLDTEPLDGKSLRRLGTYGTITGERLYILGATVEGKRALVDFGYCLEEIILQATALGLGTCWLGGLFKRSAFAAHMDLKEDEVLPAITPVGYAAEEISAAERLARFSLGAKKRKDWAELFFQADGLSPLELQDNDSYQAALEAVRRGPSASNRQPWRITGEDGHRFAFYLKANPVLNLAVKDIQFLDMGIAMCHFTLAAGEAGLAGRWVENPPDQPPRGLRYIATWEQD